MRTNYHQMIQTRIRNDKDFAKAMFSQAMDELSANRDDVAICLLLDLACAFIENEENE